ncbi:MAG: Tol biopolymer transport system component [Pseudoalteromonas tetraodonis]|jgi:Tol biopolymer transport system component
MTKQLLRIGVSAGISFAILALIMQMLTSGLADQQRPSVLAALQNSSLSLLLAFLGLYLIALFFRAYRYRLLILISGEQNVPSMRQMALVTGIRNMMVDMLPARLGELGYIGLLNRGYGVKLQHCISSLTVAIAFDFVALLIIVTLVIAKQSMGAELEGWAIGAVIMAMTLAVIALAGLFLITPLFSRWLSSAIPGKDASLWSKAVLLLRDFSDSLDSVKAAGKTTQLVVLSTIIRLLKYLGMYLLFKAVAGPSFAQLADLPFEHVVSALIGGEIGASLPIPTFMSFGAYEAGTALVFQLLGVGHQASAFVTMLCVHIWSQLMEYIIGGSLLAIFVLMKRRAKAGVAVTAKPASKLKRIIAFGSGGAVLIGGSFFLAYQLWAATKLGSLSAPAAGGVPTDAGQWRELSKQHVSAINGFVVFSSNRDGNHDIFKLKLNDFELSKLTTHAHTETYPRISPNGKQLIFSRSQQPWVSQRNTVAWDVFLLDLQTGAETKLGSNGTSPHWLNNREITFLQDASKVIKIDVQSLASQTLFEPGVTNQMPVDSKLHNPSYNPLTKQLVFTALQSEIGMNTGHWGTALTKGTTHRGVLDGCELSWNSAGTGLYQVGADGLNAGLQIVSVDPETLEWDTLIDLEGEFSHEYWPKDSSNGEYMVIGASRGKQDHEHDTKDYEIFLWKVGAQSAKATRLTFHTGNDNWPDVFIAD